MEIPAVSKEVLFPFILSQEGNVKLLEPAELRSELKETLKNQGIKVEAVEVTVESHGFESNLWQGQGSEENASYQGSRKAPRRINLNDMEGFEELTEEEDKLAAEMMEANGNTVDYTA